MTKINTIYAANGCFRITETDNMGYVQSVTIGDKDWIQEKTIYRTELNKDTYDKEHAGLWHTTTYNKQGKETSYRDSTGYHTKTRYDRKGNLITLK